MLRNATLYPLSASLFLFLLIAGCDRPEASEPEASGPTAEAREWRVLFDGSNLDEWRGFNREDVPPGWVIEDGTLYFTGANGGDIMTRDEFDDFELELEWKISEGGNSGIFFHAVENGYGAAWETAPEYQLLDDLSFPDLDSAQYTAADYDLYRAVDPQVRPAGEWNETRIVVRDGHVQYYLNGRQTVSYELGSEEWTRRVEASKFNVYENWGRTGRGHIALQDHGDPIWFRNIRIREFDAEQE